MTDMSNVEFIRDLAARMFRNATPAMGFGQGDTDRLYVIANRLSALEQAGEPVATVLPCDVKLPPATTIRAGCSLDTLLLAMNVPGRPQHFDDRAPAEAPLPTLQRLGQEFDAGEVEPVAFMYDRPNDGKRYTQDRLIDFESHPLAVKDGWTETPLYAHPPQSRVAADPVGLREAADRLQSWLDTPYGRPGEYVGTTSVACDDIRTVLAALATPPQPDPQSRGQAFDGEGEARSALEYYRDQMCEGFCEDFNLRICKAAMEENPTGGDCEGCRAVIALAALSSAKRGEEDK